MDSVIYQLFIIIFSTIIPTEFLRLVSSASSFPIPIPSPLSTINSIEGFGISLIYSIESLPSPSCLPWFNIPPFPLFFPPLPIAFLHRFSNDRFSRRWSHWHLTTSGNGKGGISCCNLTPSVRKNWSNLLPLIENRSFPSSSRRFCIRMINASRR